MKLSNIKILGKNWAVLYIDKLKDQAGDSVYGLCDEATLTISICKGLAPDLETHTLLHEITHAIDYGMDTSMTERQVDLVSGGILAVLRDNPLFAEILIGI